MINKNYQTYNPNNTKNIILINKKKITSKKYDYQKLENKEEKPETKNIMEIILHTIEVIYLLKL